MSPRPEERDDVAERLERAIGSVHRPSVEAYRHLLRDVATELAALRSEREQMAARIEKLTELLVHMRWCQSCAEDGWGRWCGVGREAVELLDTPASEPGPANPADPSPQPHD